MGSLIQVHKVHVDLLVGDLAVILGGQVAIGLLQQIKAVDPHFARGEGVAPHDDTCALLVNIGLIEGLADQFIGDQRWFPDNFKRKLRCNDAKTLNDPGEALRTDNHHRLSPVTVSHRKKHPGKPRDVIRMKMSDQNERNRIRTPALFLQCNLRALTAVEKNALPVITNQQ